MTTHFRHHVDVDKRFETVAKRRALKSIRGNRKYDASKDIRELACWDQFDIDHGILTVIRVIADGTALLVA
jgi:hypothetical protein